MHHGYISNLRPSRDLLPNNDVAGHQSLNHVLSHRPIGLLSYANFRL